MPLRGWYCVRGGCVPVAFFEWVRDTPQAWLVMQGVYIQTPRQALRVEAGLAEQELTVELNDCRLEGVLGGVVLQVLHSAAVQLSHPRIGCERLCLQHSGMRGLVSEIEGNGKIETEWRRNNFVNSGQPLVGMQHLGALQDYVGTGALSPRYSLKHCVFLGE